MPITGFLRIGDVGGESRAVGHEGEIDVLDVTWRIQQSAPTQVGRGRRRAHADVGDLVCTKRYDAASPYLAWAAATGRSFPEAVLTVRDGHGDAPFDRLRITMRNVLVSRYQILGSAADAGGGDDLGEAIALAPEELTVRYVEPDERGQGDEHEVDIDVARAT